MKQLLKVILIVFLCLVYSKTHSQISYSTLQKVISIENDPHSFSDELRGILKPIGFRKIDTGKWIRSVNNNGRETITIGLSYDGIMMSYNSFNAPKIIETIESIKRLKNFIYYNDNYGEINFRNSDKKFYYEVLYSKNYDRCTISIFPYKER